MAGSTERNAPAPTSIVVHKQSRLLEIEFSDGRSFRLPFEFLRVYSPSAEVRGHGPGQEVLQTGKRDVDIDQIDPVGHYAVQPHFSDGHATGIYAWDYLYWLGEHQDTLWQDYLKRLEEAGASRDAPPAPGAPVVAAAAKAGAGANGAPGVSSSSDASIDVRSVSRPRH